MTVRISCALGWFGARLGKPDMRTFWHRWLTWLLVLLCSMPVWAATPVPALTAPVMDTAQMMSVSARENLNRHLLDYAREHGSQIVVLTVDSIEPETSFDYATRVMDAWKPGRKGVDDGVLLLLVKNERKTHLAVGRGLEGAIPDVYAKRILADVLRPYLQQGQTDAGIQAAVLQVEKLIAGEDLPPLRQNQQGASTADLFPLLILLAVVGGTVLKALFGRTLGSLATGGVVLGAGLLFGWALALSLFIAAVATVFAFASGLASFVGGGGSGRGGGGGWHSSGGSLGGGGFSGGGGGFGGGGASGGW